MAIQELSREEVSAVSGGANLLDGVLGLVSKLVYSPLSLTLLKTVSRLFEALQPPLRR